MSKDKPMHVPRHVPEYAATGKKKNDFARALLDEARLPENKALKADIARIEEGYRDVERWANRDPAERAQWLDEQVANAQMDHWSRCQNRKTEVGEELAKYRESWSRQNKGNASERLYNLERHKVEIGLSTDKEIEAKLRQAAGAETMAERAAVDADFLLAAAGHLLNKGDVNRAAIAKSALENCNADRPWLNSERGEALQKLHDVYDCQFGLVRLDPTVSGSNEFSTLEVASLLDV